MATPMDSQEERLLEQETAIHFESYDDLLNLVQSIPIPNPNEPSLYLTPQLFPNELCTQVLQWLLVERIQMSQVSVIGFSSRSPARWNGYQPALTDCLSEDESTCWISDARLGGQNQYVDFCVAGQPLRSQVVRIQKISIQIPPPLRQGFFFLRDFCVQASDDANHIDEEWKNISPQWTLERQSGWQSFVWNDPVDVRYLRLFCLSNQLSSWWEEPEPITPMNQGVRFYSVRFD